MQLTDPPQDDTVDATIGHSSLSDSDSSTSSFDFQLDWHNSTLIDTTVNVHDEIRNRGYVGWRRTGAWRI